MASTFNLQNILILRYRDRKIAVSRDQCHNLEDLISFALLSFGSLQGISVDDVVVVTKIPGHSDTEPVEISPTLWPTMSRVVDNVTIVLVSERERSSSTLSKSSDSPASTQKARSRTLSPNLISSPSPQCPPSSLQACRGQKPLNGLQQTLPLPVGLPQLQNRGSVVTTSHPHAIKVTFISQSFMRSAPPPFSINEDGLLGQKVSYLYERIRTRIFGDLVIKDLKIGSLSLDKERSLSSYAMHSGSTVTATLTMKQVPVCKPVLYLYPPSSVADVTVKLTLVPSWNFSAVYPSQQIYLGARKVQTWNVSAEPNGTLVDKATGVEVSYLYWEAMAHSTLLTTNARPASNTMANTETFDPLYPSVNPHDSVLLSKSKLPGYLDLVLKAFALNPEARTSFMSFWLPTMQNHEHIALRFITQESYEKTVAMCITPTPDIVTRIFMLFHGVEAGDLSRWELLEPDSEEYEEASWADEVGVDTVRATDRGLFRVLELGGMEV